MKLLIIGAILIFLGIECSIGYKKKPSNIFYKIVMKLPAQMLYIYWLSVAIGIAFIVAFISFGSDFGSHNSSSSYSGSSSSSKTTCTACHGKGQVEQWYTNDPSEKGHWETCQLCKGKGYY